MVSKIAQWTTWHTNKLFLSFRFLLFKGWSISGQKGVKERRFRKIPWGSSENHSKLTGLSWIEDFLRIFLKLAKARKNPKGLIYFSYNFFLTGKKLMMSMNYSAEVTLWKSVTCMRGTEGKFPHTLHVYIQNVGEDSRKKKFIIFLNLYEMTWKILIWLFYPQECLYKERGDDGFRLPAFLVYLHSSSLQYSQGKKM